MEIFKVKHLAMAKFSRGSHTNREIFGDDVLTEDVSQMRRLVGSLESKLKLLILAFNFNATQPHGNPILIKCCTSQSTIPHNFIKAGLASSGSQDLRRILEGVLFWKWSHIASPMFQLNTSAYLPLLREDAAQNKRAAAPKSKNLFLAYSIAKFGIRRGTAWKCLIRVLVFED